MMFIGVSGDVNKQPVPAGWLPSKENSAVTCKNIDDLRDILDITFGESLEKSTYCLLCPWGNIC